MASTAEPANERMTALVGARRAADRVPPGGLKFKAAVFGVVVAIVGIVLDLGAARLFHHLLGAELVGNVFTGALAAYVMYRYMAYRVKLSEQRAAQIAYLNHHIRNGLALIMLSHYTGDDVQRLKMMKEASERIEATLTRFASEDNLRLAPLEETALRATAGR